MKININVTHTLTPEQTKTLVKIAKTCGHNFKERTDRQLVKAYLEELINNTIHYCHEKIDTQDDDDTQDEE